MCTFNYRFMPAVRFAKDLIAEGRIGTIYQIRVQYLQMAGHDPSLAARARPGTRPGRTRAACRGSAATPSTSAASWWARSPASRPWCGPSTRIGRDHQRRLPGRSDLRRRHRGRAGLRTTARSACWNRRWSPPAGRIISPGKSTARSGSLRWDLEHPNSLFACLSGDGDDSLLGLHRNLGHRKLPSLRRRMVAAGAQPRLGALPNHREVPLPRGGRPRQAARSLRKPPSRTAIAWP